MTTLESCVLNAVHRKSCGYGTVSVSVVNVNCGKEEGVVTDWMSYLPVVGQGVIIGRPCVTAGETISNQYK